MKPTLSRATRPSSARPGSSDRCRPNASPDRQRPGALRIGWWALLSLVALGAWAGELGAAPAEAGSPGLSGPKLQFESPVFDFGKVQAGAAVRHAFVFTNTGDAVLVVANVQTTCGCTTAGEWSRQVAPGQPGTIPVQFDSSHFSGLVTKAVTVTSNDPGQPAVVLQIKGTIWKPIEVTPQFAVLNVPPGAQSNAITAVRIVSNLEEPLTLSAPESNNRAFAAQLIPTTPGREFQLIVSAIPPFEAGRVQAQISLKTSSTNLPVITVNAWANIQPPLAMNPPAQPVSSADRPAILTLEPPSTHHAAVIPQPSARVVSEAR